MNAGGAMNLEVRQFRLKFFGGIIFALLAIALSGCTQAPGLNNSDYGYDGIGGSGYDLASSGSLSIVPGNSVVGLNGSIQLSATGGIPPYAFSITSGAGTLNEDNGLFTASSSAGTVKIEVRDLRGNIGTAVIVVSGGTGSNQGGVGNGALNYALGVIALTVDSTCTAGFYNVGSIPNLVDTRIACMNRGYISATSSVVIDAYVTAGGSHTSNPVCPSGYTSAGSMPDCFGGTCSGVQVLCAKYAPVSAVSKYVTNFYVTNAGSHSATGPGCYTPYVNVGAVIDCQGGTCSGYQNFCKLTN